MRFLYRLWGVDSELAKLDAPADREAMWNAAIRRAGPWARSRLLATFLLAAPLLILLRLPPTFAKLVQPVAPVPAWLLQIVFAAAVWVLSYLLFVAVCVRSLRRAVRALLRERGIHVCMACGYDLRGGAGDRCPECGTPDQPGNATSLTPPSRETP